MSKLGILLGAGVGYVLGTRDGRERYEQIRGQAQRIWKDPRVQEKRQQATEVAKQKGGELQDKASQKASEKSLGTSGDSDGTSSSSSSASPSGAGAPSVPVTATTSTDKATGTGTPSTTSPSTPSSGSPASGTSGTSGSPASSGTSAGKSNPVQKNG